MTAEKIVLIIPTLNERLNILHILRSFRLKIPEVMLLVVDSSSDGTDYLVRSKYRDDRLVRVINCGRLGRGGAIKVGYQWVRENSDAELVAIADADGSHDPDEFITLVSKSKQADLVVGSRYVKGSKIIGWPWYRLFFSRGANWLADKVLRAGINDYTNGYRVFRREMFDNLNLDELDADGFIMLSQEIKQVLEREGKIIEIPTRFVNRRRGKSNLHIGLVIESAMVMWRLWRAMQKMQQGEVKVGQQQKKQGDNRKN